MFQWLADLIVDAVRWLGDYLTGLFVGLVDLVIDGFVSLVESIPVPGFISAIPGYLSAIPDPIWYWLAISEFQFGLGVTMTALTARFIVRRLPVVG